MSRKGQQENCAVLGSLLSPRVAPVQEATHVVGYRLAPTGMLPLLHFSPFLKDQNYPIAVG